MVPKCSLVRLAQVGAGQLRWFSRPHSVDVYVLGFASEELIKREVLQHSPARPVALGVRLHWRQGVLDLICWATFMRMLVGFTAVVFGGLILVAMMGVILVSASARMDVGEVRCVCSG